MNCREGCANVQSLSKGADTESGHYIYGPEPFGPLDVFTRESPSKEILKMWGERKNTIVYITHDIAEAITLADRIILLSRQSLRHKMSMS